MVKFGQIMRITQESGKTKTERLLEMVDAQPGESSLQLSRKMGDTLSSTSSNLSRLTRLGKVRAIRQDGVFRYYPHNYKKAGEITTYTACSECGRSFINKRAAGLHYRRVHTKEGRKWTGSNKGTSLPPTTPFKPEPPRAPVTPLFLNSWLETKLKDYIWRRHIQLSDYKALKAFYDFVETENNK